MIAALLLACAPPALMDPMSPPEVDVRAALETKATGPGEPAVLTVTLTTSEGWIGDPPDFEVEGLSFNLEGDSAAEQEGREVRTLRYAISGEPGSYVIPAATVAFDGPGDLSREVSTSTLFLDLAVEGPSSELADLQLAPPPPPSPWPYVAGGAAAAFLIAGVGAFFVRRGRRPAPPPPPLPPHEAFWRDWIAARDNPSLTDEARATALSALFREYLEAVAGVEATAFTTSEVMAALERRGKFLAVAGDCKQVLSATDRVKYAREGGGEDFFKDLEVSVERVIEQTRPRQEAP
jgi:hypothetical protein